MHVLIIPGEELNQHNQLKSIFEIHQAHTLYLKGIKVGFISFRLSGSLYKDFFSGLKACNLNVNYKINISLQMIEGIHLIESSGKYKTPSIFNLYRKERVYTGLLAYKKYVREFGVPDIIHAHSRFLDSVLLAKKINDLFGVPYVITEHSTFHQRNLVGKKEYIQYVAAVNKSKSWIVVSDALGKVIMSNLSKLNLKTNKSYIILPNVVDPKFEYCEVKKTSKFVFLNIALLDDKKNHQLLIDSFKIIADKYDDVELRIGGQGPREEELMLYVTKMRLKNVFFLGTLNRSQVKEELANSKVFLLGSREETFGVVIIEALAIGRPVISTICGGPEFILDSSNGELVESDNRHDYVNAMIRMMENYGSYDLKKISANCIEKYGPNSVGKQLISIYNSALN